MSCISLQAAGCFAWLSGLCVRLSHRLTEVPHMSCCSNCQSECCETDENRPLQELLSNLQRLMDRVDAHPLTREASSKLVSSPCAAKGALNNND